MSINAFSAHVFTCKGISIDATEKMWAKEKMADANRALVK